MCVLVRACVVYMWLCVYVSMCMDVREGGMISKKAKSVLHSFVHKASPRQGMTMCAAIASFDVRGYSLFCDEDG